MVTQLSELPLKVINPECPAPRHNSVYAARGYGLDKKVPIGGRLPLCICQYSLAMLKRRTELQHLYLQRKRGTAPYRLPSWWTGPWKMSEECTAEQHWTWRAGRGASGNVRKGTGSYSEVKCICPRAVALVNHRSRTSYARRDERRDEQRKLREAQRAADARRIREARYVADIPWSKKACEGRYDIFDAASGEAVKGAEIERARDVCRTCPIIDACLAYAMQHHEEGIWGGTTTQQRRGIARKQAMQDA